MNSGSFAVALGEVTDASFEVGAHIAIIPAATNAVQTINPAGAMQGMVIMNVSASYIRAVVTFAAGAIVAGVAASRAVIVPPNGTYSVTFNHNSASAPGIIAPIDSVTVQGVTLPATTTEASALVAPATLPAAATVVVNFVQG